MTLQALILRAAAASCMAALLLAAGATAAAEKDQVRNLQQRARTAEQAKAQLAQQNAELDNKVKAAAEQLERTKRNVGAAERARAVMAKELQSAKEEANELNAKLADMEKKLAESEAKVADANAKLTQATGVIGRVEFNNRQLSGTLAQRVKELNECSVKNDNLYRVSASLMGEFEARGSSGLLGKEPITGLARVAVENKLDEYRELMELQQFLQPSGSQKVASANTTLASRPATPRMDPQRVAEEEAEQRRLEQERLQKTKAKQQSDIDRWTKKFKSYFDNLEW